MDDDTYVLWDELLRLLRKYDPDTAHYFGRPLQEEGWPVFVGGGAGIVLSRAAALQIVSMRDSPECDPLKVAWGERTHQGGDAWLGDCADASGVHVDMEYGFYPQPPVANMFHLVSDAVAFHGVEDHHAMHAALKAEAAGGGAYDTRCTPVFLDHKYHCLPHFIIGGVPKAGTTSLYKYLMQHPEVLPAEDKELTFWGNFFSPKRRPKREEVMQEYLTKFPKIEPGDFKLTGEATPGYLYCYTCPTYILRYLPKVRFIFTLRSPLQRSYSEYLNKVEDRTEHGRRHVTPYPTPHISRHRWRTAPSSATCASGSTTRWRRICPTRRRRLRSSSTTSRRRWRRAARPTARTR